MNKIFSILLKLLFFKQSILFYAWPYKKVEKRYEIPCVCQTNNSCRHRKPHC